MIYRLSILAIFLLAIGHSLAAAQSSELTVYSLQEALAKAQAEEKKVLIDVFAEWCPYCRRMHTEVYTDPAVIEALNSHFVLVKVNIESENEIEYRGQTMTERQFSRAMQSTSVPTTLFMDADGEVLGLQPGAIPSDVFSRLLRFVGSDAYLSVSFNDFTDSR
ncbi:MAG: thioredoxin family protein [Balneolaceae bacterium]